MPTRGSKKSGKHDPASNGAAEPQFLRIRGARTHNLKNIDVDIPRNQFVVLTGVSGSGKSSLAFDTILAEGQRQYIESLSVYSRQFFEQMDRPDVDRIEGLQPTIAIDQQQRADNPRSSVATITEIYDYLRLLMARVGEVVCHQCATPIAQQTTDQIEDELCRLPERTRVMILAPLVRGRKGAHREEFEQIRKAGFVRARVDGVTYSLDEVPALVPQKDHDIEAVVDRLVIRDGIKDRLAESVRLAVKHGNGVVLAALQQPEETSEPSPNPSPKGRGNVGKWETRLFNTRYMCPNCGSSIAEIEPRTFSFNSPYGACPACHGLGSQNKEGADAESAAEPCPSCNGTRLRPEARACRVGGLVIHEITALSVTAAIDFFGQLKFGDDKLPIARPIHGEITRRLEFLQKVGADYLSLNRAADTLSGGELQRVRLADGIGAGLVGVLYLFDEPSIGLHPRDNGRLISALRDLQQQGNSVIVVEHDEAVMRQADHLIDMGPSAGQGGGRIVAEGSPDEVAADEASLTGAYLSGRHKIETPQRRRKAEGGGKNKQHLTLTGAAHNNLKNIEVDIPLGTFVCVTGVSGSGKSSLVIETLGKELARRLNKASAKPGPFTSLKGVNQLERLVEVDQSPIGRTPRSNPATYTGVFDEIRKVFAATKQARQRGYGVSRFSFNAKSGRCDECQGQGEKRIEMNFLPDLYVTCPRCLGARFNQQTLQIRYRGRSIADALAMSVEEARRFFENFPPIARMLEALEEVGVGYLSLGQPSTTLSGGEAQRIKLATELGRPQTGHTLYLLDEPTTGLHTHDIGRLLGVLSKLVDQGNTVLVIEHNLDVIKSADWVIDLGPEGGMGGGRVVVAGTPEQVAACAESHTGHYLRALL